MRGMAIGVAVALVAASPAAAKGAEEGQLAVLVGDFLRARDGFDQARVDAMMAPEYQEISPIGEVDSRAAVLGFYAPEKRTPAPPMTLSDTAVRPFDRFALVTTTITYTFPGADGQPQARSMRAMFVLRPVKATWQFVSTQITPIRIKSKS